jgi:hypothetical protein
MVNTERRKSSARGLTDSVSETLPQKERHGTGWRRCPTSRSQRRDGSYNLSRLHKNRLGSRPDPHDLSLWGMT